MIEVVIRNRWNIVAARSTGEEECSLVYQDAYLDGDKIEIELTDLNQYYMISIDDGMLPGLVYMTQKHFEYEIPFREKHESYPVKAFQGNLHLITIRKAEEFEWNCYRNLSENCLDQHDNYGMYPHSHANVETRGESVFASRNAIDGNVQSASHGIWPYESWGINRQDDAWLEIQFGHEVTIDRIDLYLRADFPHDNWWNQVTVSFADDTQEQFHLVKSGIRQTFAFPTRKVKWLRLHDLRKAETESPFPALTQIAVYGRDSFDA